MRGCRRCPSSSERKARSTSNNSAGPLLLYDGNCGFCAASVQFILRHERQHVLRFASLESGAGREVRARHPELADADTMIWVEQPGRGDERVLIRSNAGLRIARYMGGPWRMALLTSIIPRAVRDRVYDALARHRHRLVRQPHVCYVPPPSVRQRFLDSPS